MDDASIFCPHTIILVGAFWAQQLDAVSMPANCLEGMEAETTNIHAWGLWDTTASKVYGQIFEIRREKVLKFLQKQAFAIHFPWP